MFKRLYFALATLPLVLLLAGCGRATPTPGAATPGATAPPAAAVPTSALAATIVPAAQEMVLAMAAGDFNTASARFDATMKSQLPPDKLKSTWEQLIAQVGAFGQVIGSRTETATESGVQYEIAYITTQFEKAAIDVRVVFDPQGNIAGLFFAPAATGTATPVAQFTPPDYDKPANYQVVPVTVGSGEWAISGTLNLPVGIDLMPGVVLVQGSGPSDRDETVGPNKPFYDIAAGLASQGIAVLRYDKRTYAHNAAFAALPNPTVKEETIDDALAAVEVLRANTHIRKAEVFVLGHSLGGSLAPRIGAADPQIAGLISMAGGVRPLEDAIVEQYQYIFMLDGSISEEEQQQLDALEAQRQKVKDPNLAADTPLDQTFGVPASYWLDLRGYNPPEAAKALTQPMLILQGERDYQATMDEFAQWKAALSSRSNVTFMSYPTLNHLFMAGTGQITPAEYSQPGHVDATVINDIANWIKKIAQ